MTIISRGKGYLVFVIAFFLCLATDLAVTLVGGKGYWESHAWPLGCALLASGGLIRVVELQLAKQSGRVLIDEQTGQRVVLPSNHQFFFIPMKWWTVIVTAFGLLVLLTNHAPGPG
jgi:hypothetical protein